MMQGTKSGHGDRRWASRNHKLGEDKHARNSGGIAVAVYGLETPSLLGCPCPFDRPGVVRASYPINIVHARAVRFLVAAISLSTAQDTSSSPRHGQPI